MSRRQAEVHRASDAARALLEEGRRRVASAAAAPGATLEGVAAEARSFVADFKERARGPRAHELLAAFLAEDVMGSEIPRVAAREREAGAREVKDARRDADDARKRAAEAEERLEEQRAAGERAAREREAVDRARMDVEKALAEARARADAAQAAKEELRREYEGRMARTARDAERAAQEAREAGEEGRRGQERGEGKGSAL